MRITVALIAQLLMAIPAFAQTSTITNAALSAAAETCKNHAVATPDSAHPSLHVSPPKFAAGWEHCEDIRNEINRRNTAAQAEQDRQYTLDLANKLKTNQ